MSLILKKLLRGIRLLKSIHICYNKLKKNCVGIIITYDYFYLDTQLSPYDYDAPRDITITAPVIPASGILTYIVPVGAVIPYVTETFTATVTNDVPAEITGAKWIYTPPGSSSCIAGEQAGNTRTNKDFDCPGFQRMISEC